MASLVRKWSRNHVAAAPDQAQLPVSDPENPFMTDTAVAPPATAPAVAAPADSPTKLQHKPPSAWATDSDANYGAQDQQLYAPAPYSPTGSAVPPVAGDGAAVAHIDDGHAAVEVPAPSRREQAATDAHNVAGLLGTCLWILCVTGLTAYQVVQNALYIKDLSSLDWSRPPAAAGGGSSYAGLEIKSLWAIMGIEAGLCLLFMLTAMWLVLLPAMKTYKAHQRGRRMKRAYVPWLITLLLAASAWFKLFTLSSLLNSMLYQGTYCTGDPSMDLVYTFDPQSTGAGAQACNPAPQTDAIRLATMFAYITIGFHTLVYFAHQPYGVSGKILGFIPAVLFIGVVNVKPFFALQNMHYTQQYFTSRGIFGYRAEEVLCIIEFITAVWLGLYIGWAAHSLRLLPRLTNTLLAWCGKDYEDVYYEKQHVVERRPTHQQQVMQRHPNPAYDSTIPTADPETGHAYPPTYPATGIAHHTIPTHAPYDYETTGTAHPPVSPHSRPVSGASSSKHHAAAQQHVLERADSGRRSYHLRDAVLLMLQQFYLATQLPAVFGFVAPMVTYFSLDVKVWWVVADIITGAVFLAGYMLLCAFHRKLLSPYKARR